MGKALLLSPCHSPLLCSPSLFFHPLLFSLPYPRSYLLLSWFPLSVTVLQVAGSVGLCGSANIGTESAMFEAVHGSAPDIAGKNMANPSGMLNGAIMMLGHMGMHEQATKIKNAWLSTIEEGLHTADIYRPDLRRCMMVVEKRQKQGHTECWFSFVRTHTDRHTLSVPYIQCGHSLSLSYSLLTHIYVRTVTLCPSHTLSQTHIHDLSRARTRWHTRSSLLSE